MGTNVEGASFMNEIEGLMRGRVPASPASPAALKMYSAASVETQQQKPGNPFASPAPTNQVTGGDAKIKGGNPFVTAPNPAQGVTPKMALSLSKVESNDFDAPVAASGPETSASEVKKKFSQLTQILTFL